MARAYNLDTQAAKEANAGGKRITETGKYVGTITAAFYEQNQKGTESVNIMFTAADGREVGPLNLYTHNGSGEPLAGYKTLNALMTCAKVRALSWNVEPLELYDFDQREVVTKQKEVAVELKGKKIGLVLQKEVYNKQSGGQGERMLITAPFEASTELMAAEILGGQKEPAALGGMMAYIAKNPIKYAKGATQQSQQPAAGSYATPPANDFDDDIPF
ncbi:hypothetical protein [Azotobacter chroococcum]|uniref:Single-stranded DNA-binding protein n=1 Tax=Azotobacter chroococcum TaxID=353 RepID=A0AAP9YJF7_9GAMM|nr:hypothetical protein [Azotobacter chroococcum]QQE90439.1 hypothetical protein GKQ51_09275 [Azotobacter chroococcum]